MTLKRTRSRHGESAGAKGGPTLEYQRWGNMLTRCRNSQNISYEYYGRRGISVCTRWESYTNFLADLGRTPSRQHQLERIDNDGNYEPGNVRWATRKEQGRNKRNNVLLTHVGRTQCLSAWAEETGFSMKRLWTRYRTWDGDADRILTTPRPTEKKFCKRGHRLRGRNLKMEEGRRRCRACARIAVRKYYYKVKGITPPPDLGEE